MNKGFWIGLSILIVFVDQISKYFALTMLTPYQPQAVFPMLDFTLAYNTGAAFSFLSGAGDWHLWFFMGFSAVASLVLLILLLRLPRSESLQAAALSLILGGALSNLIDRIHFGYVIDFIDVYYRNYHWPIFNIADSAITIGAVLLIFSYRSTGK